MSENNFISECAEQRVYRLDGSHVIKTNAGVFYECWLDYFNSLLIPSRLLS
ncbi:putative polyvalent protein kinase domain-containing protein [Mucilaginibacter paludis]|uniref:putative polyvalent protein kinase domain-containing protein n=1 Tax=Mucilaginibacter paludis TaxID=423351 RepID=UPI00145F1E7F